MGMFVGREFFWFLAQCPTQSRTIANIRFGLCSWILENTKDGDSPASLGNLLQHYTPFLLFFFFPWGPTYVSQATICIHVHSLASFREQWLNKMFWVSGSCILYLKIKNRLCYGLMGIFTPKALGCGMDGRMQISGTALGMSGNSFGTQRKGGCSSARLKVGQWGLCFLAPFPFLKNFPVSNVVGEIMFPLPHF